MKRTNRLLLILSLVFSIGCAHERVPLKYYRPGAKLQAEGPLIACREIVDGRINHSIDEALETEWAKTLDRVIHDEIASMAIAREVRTISGGSVPSARQLRDEGVDILIEPTLRKMRWVVPGYDRIVALSTLSFLGFGLIGWAIYLDTKTDVYGGVELDVAMTDLDSGVERISTYKGLASERIKKADCDLPGTKSRLVGKALSIVMEQLKADLVEFSSSQGLAVSE